MGAGGGKGGKRPNGQKKSSWVSFFDTVSPPLPLPPVLSLYPPPPTPGSVVQFRVAARNLSMFSFFRFRFCPCPSPSALVLPISSTSTFGYEYIYLLFFNLWAVHFHILSLQFSSSSCTVCFTLICIESSSVFTYFCFLDLYMNIILRSRIWLGMFQCTYGVILILLPHLYLCEVLPWDIHLWNILLHINIHKSLANFWVNTLGKKCVYEYF